MPQEQSHTTASIAAHLGGELLGPDHLAIDAPSAMRDAQSGCITFISSGTYARQWHTCGASAAVISRGLETSLRDTTKSRSLIVVDDAELAMAKVLELFAPEPALPDPGIHVTAAIHDDATIGDNVRIGPHVSVGRGARIGNAAVLHAGVRVYEDAAIGDESTLHANVVIRERCTIGRRVILHQGVSIGADGFGYRPDRQSGALIKMPHVGNVVIEDDVEIGANSCVDRAKFSSTIIGRGTKLDNFVQVAHNCRIGRSCVIAGQTGLAGSVVIGDGVQVGAQVGIAEGVVVGDGARVGAQSGLMKDVPPGETVFGTPADSVTQTLRQTASLRKLPSLVQRLTKHLKNAQNE